jgi:CBS domain-containing protein
MKARDIMVSPVVTAKPHSTVKDVANVLLDKGISAVPVVDHRGELVGIVSEGDLLHRVETGTQARARKSFWLRFVAGNAPLAEDYAKAHGRKVSDVMTKHVIVAAPDTPLSEVAMLMERHNIKRVPILSDGRLVGIVSRSNLVQALASAPSGRDVPLSDQAIRDKLLAHLHDQPWSHTSQLNVTVNNGVVDVWGICHSDAEHEAVRIAAENIPGVREVKNNLSMPPPGPIF